MTERYSRTLVRNHFERLCAAVGREPFERFRIEDGVLRGPLPGMLSLEIYRGYHVEEYKEHEVWEGDRESGKVVTRVSPFSIWGMTTRMTAREFCDAVNFTIGAMELADPAGTQQRIAEFFRRKNEHAEEKQS